eukprot:3508703-Amphidinium_carterae.1
MTELNFLRIFWTWNLNKKDDECKLSIWVDGLGADAAIAGATAMLSPTSPTRKGGQHSDV